MESVWERGSRSGDNAEGPDNKAAGMNSDDEEEDMRKFLDDDKDELARAVDEVCGWSELQEKIKTDHKTAHKENETPTKINQFLILRNFATPQTKGLGRMATSQQIALQWHKGKGTYFAHQIRVLAHYYQRYEQLPVEKQGGDGGRSLLNDEQV